MVVERRWRIGLRTLALGYLALLLLLPVAVIFYRTFEHGIGAVWDSVTTPAAVHAFWLTVEVTVIAVPLNTVFGILAALALVRGGFRGKALLRRADRPAVRRLAGRDRPVADPGLRHARAGSATSSPTPGSRSSSRCPGSCWRRSSSRCRSSCARSRRCCARSATSRSRPPRRSAPRLADVLAGHAAVDPLGHRLRRRAVGRALHRRVRRRQRRLAARSPARPRR